MVFFLLLIGRCHEWKVEDHCKVIMLTIAVDILCTSPLFLVMEL